MMNSKTEFLVGLFVVVGIASLFFLVLQTNNLRNKTFTSTYIVKANFDNIGSLRINSQVKSSGVTIGRVKNISLDTKSFLANVTMNINKKYLLPVDTSASILTSGLLGEQYIDINPGNEEENIKHLGCIVYTQGFISIEQLMSKFLYSSNEKNIIGLSANDSEQFAY
ncbi:ABC transport system substrate-binding protein [Candidatus Kinetoplastibacterium oncopeltii TCC290E]|uniref:ABC transport system substrate-binding protein n=1 Tax=Candidatus Kinetoplastidibacterium stringomonadis TCC290E TaxID=1208920 RepID=M1LR46_9PROT|nr:outer membrane lipid asymmetry maintenance protein MlaD [Candidatus Kinetoplastibacterium oncopeltii]AGF48062.1 ABC transport system substrate-binding protein [Candidatus Kinetoplastibacterium oncopeltii TCC290E]